MTQVTKSKAGSERATVTFHTTPEIKARLEKLAALTHRSRSYISNEALERYLAEEESFIASIKKGLKDAKAGRVKTTAEASKLIRALVANK